MRDRLRQLLSNILSVSLLNLPSQIAYYGALLLYWDGILERGIQTIKSELTFLQKRVSFLSVKLRGVRAKQNFDRIFKLWFPDVGVERNWYIGYKSCCNTLQQIEFRLREGLPLSFFCLDSDICIPLKHKKVPAYIKVEVDRTVTKDCSLHSYFKIKIPDDVEVCEVTPELRDSITDFGVLLPLVKRNEKTNLYTAMTRSRRSFDAYGELLTKCLNARSFQDLFLPPLINNSLAGRHIAVVFPFEEKSNGRLIAEGLSWYDGVICDVDQSNRCFTILWEGKDNEVSKFDVDLAMYGLMEEGGWIVV